MCAGDCDGNQSVTVDELLICVDIALGTPALAHCSACDFDNSGGATIDELVAVVNMVLNGCATPTPVTFDQIQAMIFTPTCATQFCHDAQGALGSGNLNLTQGVAYDNLVDVAPNNFVASSKGLLRVDAGHPDNSFLLIKLQGPAPGEGSPMPLTGGSLSAAQIQMVHDWILQGAQP